jgi:WD40 repeat protein
MLAPSTQEIAGLVFAGDRLVVAGRDGTLRVFDAATGKQRLQADAGAPLVGLAVSPDRRLAATADDRHRVHLFDLRTGTRIETLEWHRATIAALGWGIGSTLLVADNDGELALWDVPALAD